MRIGPYEVVRELGRGGMGVVYEAREPGLERPVAIKLLRPEAIGPEERARFAREAQALAAVRHPGVVAVHTAGETPGGEPYLVTDLVQGRDLIALLGEGGPLGPRRAAELVRDVADAVEALHRAGVLHRDIKPANVLLVPSQSPRGSLAPTDCGQSDPSTPSRARGPMASDASLGVGRPVLIDFGLARRLDATRLTETGTILGTPAAMAPEQAEGRTDLDARVDVHGLGALLLHLVSGRPPFAGPTVQALYAALEKEPAWPETVPAGLAAIGRRALAKDRDDRHPTAAALRDALGGWLAAPPTRPRSGVAPELVVAGLAVVGLGAAILAAALAPIPPQLADSPAPPSSSSGVGPSRPVERSDPLALYAQKVERGAPPPPGKLAALTPDAREPWAEDTVVAFVPGQPRDDPRLVVARPAKGAAEVVLWRPATDERRAWPVAPGGPRAIAVHPELPRVLVGVGQYTVAQVDVAGTLTLHEVDRASPPADRRLIRALGIDPAGRWLAIARWGVVHLHAVGPDGALTWRSPTLEVVEHQHINGVALLASTIVVASEQRHGLKQKSSTLSVWPLPPIADAAGKAPPAGGLVGLDALGAAIRRGDRVLLASHAGRLLALDPGRLELVAETGLERIVARDHDRAPMALAGDLVFTLAPPGEKLPMMRLHALRLRDRHMDWLREVEVGPASSLAASPDGLFVAIVRPTGAVEVWGAADLAR